MTGTQGIPAASDKPANAGEDEPASSKQDAHPGWRSRWLDIDGPVRYLDFGGPARGPAIVCVHGLSGSAVNWAALAPLLTDRYRALAPDLAGHGLTRSGGRGTDVSANRALLHRFIESVAAGPVILMGNSMGGMISLLEASSAPDLVAGLILVDPALPFVPARPDLVVAAMFALTGMPVVGRAALSQIRHVAPETAVAAALALCCANPSRVDPDVVSQHVKVASQRSSFTHVGPDMAAATRSVIATAAGLGGGPSYRHRIAAIACPVLLVHGERDRLVPVSAARAAARANPGWSLLTLPDVGHVPQLEAPRECATAIREWLGSSGRPAAESAVPVAGLLIGHSGRRRRPGRWPALDRLRHRRESKTVAVQTWLPTAGE
jgi:pimeloyl-ACP methyl ester carboxylesterase